MVRPIGLLSALVLISLAACAASPDSEAVDGSEAAATAARYRAVDVIVSAKQTGETYEARAYPIDDVNDDGLIEYYRAPVYYVYVSSTDANGIRETREWKAPRFMPYNNPAGKRHDYEYRENGFFTAGLTNIPRFAVGMYKPNYEVHNRYSPFGGAIVVRGGFYIHAGPEGIEDKGWGSAGCVEIFGDFDAFKRDILELAGSQDTGSAAALNTGMGRLIAAHKLFVTYEAAARPDIKANYSRQVDPNDIGNNTLENEAEPANDNPTEPTDQPPT
jgi:hypothetical protein